MLAEKLYVYSYLSYYEDMGNKKYQEYKEKATSILEKVESLTSFVNPELLSNDFSLIEKYISKNKKLEIYRRALENLFRFKDHILSEKEEKILSDASEAFKTPTNAYDAIDNVDIKFDKIKNENNEDVELTPYNYGGFLASKNRDVRKSAFMSEYKFYKEHINTLSSLYIGNVKNNSFICNVRGYDSILDMHLYPDEISNKLYKTLISVTDDNIHYLKDFYKYKSKKLGYKMHMYDLYVNTSNMIDKKIKYEEAINIVNNALEVLGSDYLSHFNEILNNRCVDVYPRKYKRSGAFEWGIYGISPYVSLNYDETINSVSTLAHEMGHAMHTYYSNKNQDYLYAGYPVVLA